MKPTVCYLCRNKIIQLYGHRFYVLPGLPAKLKNSALRSIPMVLACRHLTAKRLFSFKFVALPRGHLRNKYCKVEYLVRLSFSCGIDLVDRKLYQKYRHYVNCRQPSVMSQEYRNLPMLLYKARESFMTQFRPILNEYGVTEQQWRIIRALAEQGDLEPRQLCEQCLILSPSMAGMLKRMEEVGLIEKIPMEDQRRIRIHLTDGAQQLYIQAKERITQEYQNIAEKIGHESIARLYQALDIIIEELKPFQNSRT